MSTSSDAGTATYDKERAKQFLSRMTQIMNGGALSLLCSLGHKTGLFDTMAGMGPATPAEIAEAAGLQERYVREWLNGMTVGGVIDHDADAGTYQLPAEHSGLLTRAAGPLNLATYCQMVALLAQVEEDVAEKFQTGGGVPYDRYPTFHQLMAEQSGLRYDRALLSQVVPLLPGGAAALEAGLDVADVGCGSGRAVCLLAQAFPNSRFVGYDISAAALAGARDRAAAAGVENATFIERDAAALGEHQRFDLVTTFDAIHDQAQPAKVLSGIHEMLRPGGTYLCVEPKASSHVEENHEIPNAAFMYAMSLMHCMTVSLAYDGEGVGAAWGEQMQLDYLHRAGFTDIEVTGIKDDRTNTYFLAKRPL